MNPNLERTLRAADGAPAWRRPEPWRRGESVPRPAREKPWRCSHSGRGQAAGTVAWWLQASRAPVKALFWGGERGPGPQVARSGFCLPDSDICESKVEPDRRRRSQGVACRCGAGAARSPSCADVAGRLLATARRASASLAVGATSSLAHLAATATATATPPAGDTGYPHIAGRRWPPPPAARRSVTLAALRAAQCGSVRKLSRSPTPLPIAGEGQFVRRWRDLHANDVFP